MKLPEDRVFEFSEARLQRFFVVFGTDTAERGCIKTYRMPSIQERTAISVSSRLQSTLEHQVIRRNSGRHITPQITIHVSVHLPSAQLHNCRCKCCNLRTSKATLAAELNTENRRCPNGFLTSTSVMTLTIRGAFRKDRER